VVIDGSAIMFGYRAMEDTMLIDAVDPAVAEEVDQWSGQQAAAWGFLPNYVAAFASRPDVARAWTKLNLTIRDGMDRRRFEIATIAAARALRSTYCTAAHSKFLRDVCGDEPAMRAIAAAREDTSLDDTDRAVLAFAGQVALDAASVTASDIDAVREVGLSDNDIADIVFAVAARSFFTRVLDGFGIQADHQLGNGFDPELRDQLVVGRPFALPNDRT
jgi:uncharacterized peroxidase-related enzyme